MARHFSFSFGVTVWIEAVLVVMNATALQAMLVTRVEEVKTCSRVLLSDSLTSLFSPLSFPAQVLTTRPRRWLH